MARLRDAALLGGASGLRTFAAPAALVLRGRLVRGPARLAVLAAAAGELAGDKHPAIPERTSPPALGGRILSAAVAGNAVAGPAGAGVAAAAATASAFAGVRVRATAGKLSRAPDVLIGAGEDALALGAAAAGSRAHAAHDAPPAPGSTGARPGVPAPVAAARPSVPAPVAAAARGLAAGVAGTAAMTVVQTAYLRATGAAPSSAPGEVGRRILEGVFDRRVPRRRRPALNQAMHWLYGISWGIPLGLLAHARGARSTPVAAGAAFGLGVWGVSLLELPALGLAPPVWRQPPGAVSRDAGFHVVYGIAAAAALKEAP